MNPIMKLAAVAVGALGIAGGVAMAQTTSSGSSDTLATTPSTETAPVDPVNRTGVSAPANVSDDASATTDNSLSPRSDRN